MGDSRAGVYSFLSSILLREIGLEEVRALRRVVDKFPEPFRSEALQSLDGDDEDVYLRLRVDFTKTLLLYVHLYESVFRDPSGLLCTDVSAEVKEFYLKMGYEPSLSETGVRCFDHLGYELAFMSLLAESGDETAMSAFLREHLAKWAPMAGLAIAHNASTGFYRAVGRLIAHIVLSDYRELVGGKS